MTKLLKKIKKICINREVFLYAFFGVVTSVENVVLFDVLLMMDMKYTIANLITLVIVKLTAYICNKHFVFKSKCSDILELLKEIWRFTIARGATMLVDYFGLIIMIEFMDLPKMPSKIIITVFVVLINYILGKKHVFKNAYKQDEGVNDQ